MQITSLYFCFQIFWTSLFLVLLQFSNRSLCLHSAFHFNIYLSDSFIFSKHRFYHLTSSFKQSLTYSSLQDQSKLCRLDSHYNLLCSHDNLHFQLYFSAYLFIHIYLDQNNLFSVLCMASYLRFQSCCSLILNFFLLCIYACPKCSHILIANKSSDCF